jgi:GNAT superfamily N-acetyltransferase
VTDIAVRPVERADRAAWRRLWDGYNAFYGRSGPTALAEPVVETTWVRFFDAGEPMEALVAEAGGRLVGLAHIVFHRSMTAPTSVCYLQDLFTDPAARGQGVGRALIEAVYRRAKAAGAVRVYWQTHETNATAMRLYDTVAERTGFVVYARRL